MESDPTPQRRHPAWMLWRNPIVRRYARSRLRLRGLGVSLLMTLMLAGFIFFMARSLGRYRMDMDIVDAERGPILPLLFLQGFILFILGTGQVAGGMTTEKDEGVLDYQRLSPMTPLAKVVGFLFGLPIREYVAFFATMPFSIWALWRGQVPLEISLQLYGVFLIAAVLYHLTGLLAGTVVKNRRAAFLSSMGFVFLLYTVVPQASKVGLVYFKYVTIQPVVREFWPHFVQREFGAMGQTLQNLIPPARFFNLDFPQSVFTALTQLVLIFAMFVMLWRRWRRAESHLLGKLGATALFGWVQIMLLGNALPLIDRGDVFPSSGMQRVFSLSNGGDWSPQPLETVAMAGAYGLVTLLILWFMMSLITPSREGQIRGWRRARKLGRSRLSPISDPATSFPWVMLMVAMGTAGWFWFTKSVIESDWFPGAKIPMATLGAFALVMVTGGFGYQALLESKGPRATGLCAILLGLAPILLGAILGASSDLTPVAAWVIGLSPAAAPVYAAAGSLAVPELPVDLARAMPRAFWFWQAVMLALTLNMLRRLREARVDIARQTAVTAEGPGPPVLPK